MNQTSNIPSYYNLLKNPNDILSIIIKSFCSFDVLSPTSGEKLSDLKIVLNNLTILTTVGF